MRVPRQILIIQTSFTRSKYNSVFNNSRENWELEMWSNGFELRYLVPAYEHTQPSWGPYGWIFIQIQHICKMRNSNSEFNPWSFVAQSVGKSTWLSPSCWGWIESLMGPLPPDGNSWLLLTYFLFSWISLGEDCSQVWIPSYYF